MLKKLAIVLVLILAIAVFLVARDWDSPELGQAILDQVGDATGMKMTATGFRLNLLRGLVLENVEVSSRSEWARARCNAGPTHLRAPTRAASFRNPCH